MTRLRRDRKSRERASLGHRWLCRLDHRRLRRLRRIVGLGLHLGAGEQRHHGNIRHLGLHLQNGADEHKHDNLDQEIDGDPSACALQQLRHEREDYNQQRRLVETTRLRIGVRRTNAQSVVVVVETTERERGLQCGIPLSSIRITRHERIHLDCHILQGSNRVRIQ